METKGAATAEGGGGGGRRRREAGALVGRVKHNKGAVGGEVVYRPVM